MIRSIAGIIIMVMLISQRSLSLLVMKSLRNKSAVFSNKLLMSRSFFAPEWPSQFEPCLLREAVKEMKHTDININYGDDDEKIERVKKFTADWNSEWYVLDKDNNAHLAEGSDKVWAPNHFKPSVGMEYVASNIDPNMRKKKVSTVFLGVDHRFGRPDKGDKPLLFETLVFKSEYEVCYCEQCSTWSEAVLMHKKVCDMVRNGQIDYNVLL